MRVFSFFSFIYLAYFAALRSAGKGVCGVAVALCCVTHCVTDFSTNSSRNHRHASRGSDPLAISISDGAEFFSLVWPKKKKRKAKTKKKLYIKYKK